MSAEERMDELREALGLDKTEPEGDVDAPKSTAKPGGDAHFTTEKAEETPEKPSNAVLYAKKAYRFCRLPPVMGALTFLFLFVIFLITKPGFLGTEVVNDKGESARKANVKLCLITSGVVGAVVAGLPYLIKLWMTKKAPGESA